MQSLQRAPRTTLFAIAAAVIVVAELFANVVDVGDNDSANGSVGSWIGLSAFGILVTALLLLVVVPRATEESRRTIALASGVLALITIVAFWSALPFAFGFTAIAASAAAPRVTVGSWLGLLAIAIAFVFCIVG